MCNRSDPTVFECPHGVEHSGLLCGVCDAGVCDVAVDICCLIGR
jgi:hypothetical protein